MSMSGMGEELIGHGKGCKYNHSLNQRALKGVHIDKKNHIGYNNTK